MDTTVLYTQRNLNSSLIIFIGGLLGSIFGLLSSYGTIMSIVEDFTDKVNNKYKRKQTLKKINMNKKIILRNWEKYNLEPKFANEDNTKIIHPIQLDMLIN